MSPLRQRQPQPFWTPRPAVWDGRNEAPSPPRYEGQLILQTYSHVRPEHSNRMAALMSDERPANIIALSEQTAQA
jgi:hypothetical protein